MAAVAQTPPMGWRSWNLFRGNVNQTLLESILRGVALNRRYDSYTDQYVSLCDLGYCDVGLDDNWQDCDSPLAAPGMHYHDANGNSLIHMPTFPNLKAMVELAHNLNLTAGWYHNNCICPDHCGHDEPLCERQIRQDAKATAELGFDGVKLDGCGGQVNLTQWQYYLHRYSAPKTIVVENCHWGRDPPPTRDVDGCPYHFYRTSPDIYPEYKSMVDNLQSVERYHRLNLSFPGCWAYPDMLQVGVHHPNQRYTGLNAVETRYELNRKWCVFIQMTLLTLTLTLTHTNVQMLFSCSCQISFWGLGDCFIPVDTQSRRQ
jgi:alpha-galactosidase